VSETIIEFPGREPPPEGYSKEYVDELHAEAFRDLENRLNDCVSMACIAAEQIHNLKTEDRELVFAVAHTWELLAKLKKDYYHAWHGENRGGLHTSST
jgi:hypothetical protein